MLTEDLRRRLKNLKGKIENCYSEFSLLHLSSLDGKYILITPPDFEYWEDIPELFGKTSSFFPSPKDEIFSSLPPSKLALALRVKTMWRASYGLDDIIVTPVNALLPLPSSQWLKSRVVILHREEELELELLVSHLQDLEYSEKDFVREVGEYSVRGGILDFYSGWEKFPTRIEFSGDRIESIRSFDFSSQLSVKSKKEAIIGPFREYSLNEAESTIKSLMKFVSKEETYGLKRILSEMEEGEPGEVFALIKKNLSPALSFFSSYTPAIFNREGIYKYLEKEKKRLEKSHLPYPALEEIIKLPERSSLEYCIKDGNLVHFHPVEVFKGSPAKWEKWLNSEKSIGKKVIVIWDKEKKPEFANEVKIGSLKRGFYFEDFIILGRENLLGKEEKAKKIKKIRKAGSKLEEGKPVVHEDYGIGIFRGLVRYSGEIEGDFLAIEYDSNEKLYVPVESSYKVHPYNVPEGFKFRLDRLSSPRWGKLKEKVKKEVEKIVESMVELYAERKAKKGFSFREESLFEEFISDFEFEETEDQKKAWEEVKEDMEKDYPMDRLIVGDVGFGKTEIAMRAAFLAVLNNKQVALLAPTTVLALQHYKNFLRRFRNYPVNISLLCRLTPKREEEEAIEYLKKGKIDIIIGTHRLLSDDIGFRDLGLLIIDEEQRFGVKHKEKLRELKKEIDSLTMTATPIPRTLSLALFSVWDLSIIQTPPPGRKEVETFVLPFKYSVFREAIEKEISRGGQVYVVLNRIEELPFYKEKLTNMFPSIPILVLHGRMKSSSIEKGVIDFMEGKYPVLLTTTIIENGVDIPNVNTLIVLKAEKLGFAQLHQLRGRVGRSYRKAFSYFFIMDSNLSGKAKERLRTIKEFSYLGAGFRISLEDLNLRGSGTLLGTSQHGHIAELGMDYYLKLLEDTISKMKGKAGDVELRLGISVSIPRNYIRNPQERINYYREITSAESNEELGKIEKEIEDKYGRLPDNMKSVFALGRIAVLARKASLKSMERKGNEIYIQFYSPPDPASLYKFLSMKGGRFEENGIFLPSSPSIENIERTLKELYNYSP